MSIVDQIKCSYNEFEDVEFEYLKGDNSLNYLYDIFNPHQSVTDTDEYCMIDGEMNLSTSDYSKLLSETMKSMFSPESIAARKYLLHFLLRFDEEYDDTKNIFNHDDYPLNEFVLESVFGGKTKIILSFHLLNIFNNFCFNNGILVEIPKTEIDKSIVEAIEKQVLLSTKYKPIHSCITPNHNDYLYTESYDLFVEEMCHILEKNNHKITSTY